MSAHPITTPWGEISARIYQGYLCAIQLDGESISVDDIRDPLIDKLQQQLDRYFKDADYRFDIPMQLSGTPFQQRVWQALRAIPSGSVVTYGELAKTLNSSARAVGNACRANPIPIIVPCHRVVSANGLGGYAGDTHGGKLQIKQFLLKHEGALG